MSIKGAPYKNVYHRCVIFPFMNYVIWYVVGGGGYVKIWHKLTKGEVGVWNGLKKDDVIHEQPLIVPQYFTDPVIDHYRLLF